MRRNLAVVALAAPTDRAGDRASGAFQRPAGDKPPAPASCAHSNLGISAPLLPAVRAGRLHHKPFAADPCVEDLHARPTAPLDIALGRCRHRLRYSRPPAGEGGGEGKSPCDRMGMIIEGDNKWVALIQNAARACIESKAKRAQRCGGNSVETHTSPKKRKSPKRQVTSNTQSRRQTRTCRNRSHRGSLACRPYARRAL